MTRALLIIDMQHDFVVPGGAREIPGAHATIGAIRQALWRHRKYALPVFHILREYREDGSDIEMPRHAAFMQKPFLLPGSQGATSAPGLEPEKGEYRVVKRRFSAFFQTELDLLLRRKGITHVTVTGTQLPFCLRATLFDGLSLDYHMTLLIDGSSSSTAQIHAANIKDCTEAGITCMTVQQYLQRVQGEQEEKKGSCEEP